MPAARKAGRYDPAGQPAPSDPGTGSRVGLDALVAARTSDGWQRPQVLDAWPAAGIGRELMKTVKPLIAAALVAVAAGPAAAGDLISGPVPGAPTRVVDGDTMEVTATPWPDVSVRTSMRLLGLDTPELRGRRPSERTAAQAAARHQTQIVGGIERLHLVNFDTPAAPSGDCWPTVSTCHSP
ncbi:MAG: hypothetical protein LDL44_04160 [Caenispirillum sp.]|nr:hypothetical protein [Caenispirillum sp.]